MGSLLLAAVSCALAAAEAVADFGAGLAAYQRGDYEAALAAWQPLAEGGMVEAQYNLGLLLQLGHGRPADPGAAHGWYLRAARAGYARAQYRVAEMYTAGEGVRADRILAHFWFRLASEARYLDARKCKKRVAREMSAEQIAYAEMLARQYHRDGTLPE